MADGYLPPEPAVDGGWTADIATDAGPVTVTGNTLTELAIAAKDAHTLAQSEAEAQREIQRLAYYRSDFARRLEGLLGRPVDVSGVTREDPTVTVDGVRFTLRLDRYGYWGIYVVRTLDEVDYISTSSVDSLVSLGYSLAAPDSDFVVPLSAVEGDI